MRKILYKISLTRFRCCVYVMYSGKVSESVNHTNPFTWESFGLRRCRFDLDARAVNMLKMRLPVPIQEVFCHDVR